MQPSNAGYIAVAKGDYIVPLGRCSVGWVLVRYNGAAATRRGWVHPIVLPTDVVAKLPEVAADA